MGGTSAACPAIAGLVALINSQRLGKGKPALGFLNPLLYKVWTATNGNAFNDIVEGSNHCTEKGCLCKTGFQAAKGWDASSGLGTPNFGRFVDAVNNIDRLRKRW